MGFRAAVSQLRKGLRARHFLVPHTNVNEALSIRMSKYRFEPVMFFGRASSDPDHARQAASSVDFWIRYALPRIARHLALSAFSSPSPGTPAEFHAVAAEPSYPQPDISESTTAPGFSSVLFPTPTA